MVANSAAMLGHGMTWSQPSTEVPMTAMSVGSFACGGIGISRGSPTGAPFSDVRIGIPEGFPERHKTPCLGATRYEVVGCRLLLHGVPFDRPAASPLGATCGAGADLSSRPSCRAPLPTGRAPEIHPAVTCSQTSPTLLARGGRAKRLLRCGPRARAAC